MTIAAVLRTKGNEVETIGAGDRLAEAVDKLGQRRIGALPVCDGSEVCGIISERDIIYCLRDHGAEVLDWPVSRVMTSPVITTTPDTDVLAALALMTQRRIRHLPVADGDHLLGIVSIGDLVKHRMERIEAEAEAMREYIQSA
jgi:CBS domain-containing protein